MDTTTNTTFSKKAQINLAQYSNRNILDDNFYIHKDYHPHHSSEIANVSSSSSSTIVSASNPITTATSDLTVTSSSVPSSANAHPINEQLSVLFPKCRPKPDSNSNKTSPVIESSASLLASTPSAKSSQLTFASSLGASALSTIKGSAGTVDIINSTNAALNYAYTDSDQFLNNTSFNEEHLHLYQHQQKQQYSLSFENRNSSTKMINNNSNQDIGTVNGLNSSILGTFQSRNGTMPYSRGGGTNDVSDYNNKTNHHSALSDFHTGNGRYVWEKRRRSPNTTPASTVLNSPDLTEMHHYSHHQIKVGRSPVNQHDGSGKTSTSSTSPVLSVIGNQPQPPRGGRPMALVTDGEVVVFDDIGDNWRTSSLDSDLNQKALEKQQKQPPQQLQQQSQSQFQLHAPFDSVDNDLNNDELNDSEHINNANAYYTDVSTVTKMIGKFYFSRISMS